MSEKQEASQSSPGIPVAVPHAPSVANLKAILLRSLEIGIIRPTPHFVERCRSREFSMVDAELIIEEGEIIAGPIYVAEHRSWRCEIFGKVDGRGWKLVVALDCDSDFCESPAVTIVTVHRIGVKRAKRKKGQ